MRHDHFTPMKDYLKRLASYIIQKPYFDESTLYDKNLIDYKVITNGVYDSSIPISNVYHTLLVYYIDFLPTYRDERLLHFAKDSLDYFLYKTNIDGSQNLYLTNFHDPNQVGFQGYYLQIIDLVVKYTQHTELEDEIYEKLMTALHNSAKALTTLGFHTPNHRWVQSSTLALLKKYINDPKIDETLKKYFWEGIDCDENGEYTERSTGVYNYINNEAFIQLFVNTKDYSFLEYPRRNLMLMRSFFEPNMTCNTMNSLRQDAGDSSIPSAKYYWQYLFVAAFLQDHELAYMADKLYDYYVNKSPDALFEYPRIFSLVDQFGNFEELINSCDSYTDNPDFSIFLPESKIARKYLWNGDVAITICEATGSSNPDIFKLAIGNNSITGRYGSAFFGKPHSQFRPTEIVKNDDGSISLISHEEQGYRSQFDEKPETSVWRHMDHSKRKWINIQTLDTIITFKVNDDNVDIDFSSTGTDSVCTKFELSFDNDGLSKLITKDGFEIFTEKGGYCICSGDFEYYYPSSGVLFDITGCKPDHSYSKDLRGTIPPDKSTFTVSITGITPCKKHINIKFSRIKHFSDIKYIAYK